MAANNIIYLPHQPVQLYKVAPTVSEKADGQRKWSETAYHKRLGTCYFISPPYCHPVNRIEDNLTFQFKARTTKAELMNQAFGQFVNGTNTSVVADHLIDTLADFVSAGVTVNSLVTNLTDNTSTYVISVDSLTDLELEDDIFLATPRDYRVYLLTVTGNWRYNETLNYFYQTTAAVSATITFPTIIGVGTWYKLTIELRNVTAGSVDIFLGTNNVATLDSNGVHVIYGQCTGTTDFSIVADADFVGRIMGETYMEMYEIQTTYEVLFYDLNENWITSFPWTETSDSLTIGNIFVNVPWSEHISECGNYIIGISADYTCEGDMINNGDFADGEEGWTLNGSVSITNNGAEFIDAGIGDSFIGTVTTCPIVEGHRYRMTWEVSDVSALGEVTEGSYGIFDNSNAQVSPTYAPSAQVGQTITLEFTAPNDSPGIGWVTLANPTTFRIDNITMEDITEIAQADADGLSECYCVCDADCTIKVEFTADQPTLGEFYDSNNVKMEFRIPGGALRNFAPNMLSMQPLNTTQSNMIQPYSKNQKEEELATLPMPEWAHDSLGAALSHPIVYLDGVRYIGISIAPPDWNDDIWLAPVIHRVAQVNQKYRENTY